MALLASNPRLWLLDEHGTEPTSVEFSTWLGRAQQDGRDLAIAVGGASGHGQAVRDRAEKTISLGRITLPHRLARLVAAEQIYRAFTLLRGEPYHRE